ncbi:FadR/GntR family transcriptional regulator [Paenibacillus hunanensis]|uniref:FadR/GntR family transcriptional regulator n=1 Tax=Paenibacillus hunanensis TaxID=539262 RepID=UPI0016662972|nr:FadR/GntR family transcriptional regulator [Paenibacillus hunanensis]
MFDKLEKKSLVEQLCERLEQQIRSGAWQVGMRIPKEADLMEQFGVSRNTLREAVRALVHVGLLSTRQGDGTFVVADSPLGPVLQKRLSSSSAIEILEVRHALDREAVVLACARRTEEQLVAMEHYAGLCEQHRAAEQIEQFVDVDMHLHQMIVEASGNALLVDLYQHLFERIQMSIMSTTEVSSDGDHTGHRNLIAAIRERNEAQAAAIVDDYIGHFKNILIDNKADTVSNTTSSDTDSANLRLDQNHIEENHTS